MRKILKTDLCAVQHYNGKACILRCAKPLSIKPSLAAQLGHNANRETSNPVHKPITVKATLSGTMAKKRKRKPNGIIHLSSTPLPALLQAQHTGLMVFSDASRKTCGGLAAVLFENSIAPPRLARQSVVLMGSNELELCALLFGLAQADIHFPDRPLSLFSDNSDAVERINRAKNQGSKQDSGLMALYEGAALDAILARSTIHWIKGHGKCRGNALADEQARFAANGSAPDSER